MPGWNLLYFPVPDIRCVDICPDRETQPNCQGQALASIAESLKGLIPTYIDGTLNEPPIIPKILTDYLDPELIYWVYIDSGEEVVPYFAPPKRQPDGNLAICDGADLWDEVSFFHIYLPLIEVMP
jgi:hypothetical protein